MYDCVWLMRHVAIAGHDHFLSRHDIVAPLSACQSAASSTAGVKLSHGDGPGTGNKEYAMPSIRGGPGKAVEEGRRFSNGYMGMALVHVQTRM